MKGDLHSYFNTVSLQALLNFIGLRMGDGAQSEIGAYAQAIVELIEPIVPISMEAWSNTKS
ncbi:MAG: FAD-dependent thymidylate synthase [Waterburya sp.]